MAKLDSVLLTIFVFCSTATTHYTTKPTPIFTPRPPIAITKECMNCLCQTMSHCVVDNKCTGDACGPFRINWEYWAASGKPVIHNGVSNIGNKYIKCVKNWGCSVRSVLGYLSRFQQDCNGNGKIDCYDYIATHLFGPHECRKKKLTGKYLQRYQSCACGKIRDCH